MKDRSKRDALGAITVRSISGLDNNAAARTAKEFEQKAGGRDQVAEKLEALGDQLPGGLKGLAKAIRSAPKRDSLAKIIARERASLVQTMKWYAKGCIELSQIDAAIETHQNMPAIVRDMVRHALDQPGICQQCSGTGALREKSTDRKAKLKCEMCDGTGKTLVSSAHKEWTTKALLRTSGLEPQQGGTNVNVAVGVSMAGGKAYGERVIDLADRVLHGQEGRKEPEAAEPPLEAEVVSDAG